MTELWLAVVALLVLALLFMLLPLLRRGPTDAVAAPLLGRRVYADQLAQIESDVQARTLSPQERAEAIDDLQRQALDEAGATTPPPRVAPRPWMAWGVAGALSIAVPAAALLLYLKVGNPAAVATQMLAAQRSVHDTEGVDMESMVSRLALRLQGQPNDVEGWIMLARSYEVLQRYDDAVVAYQKAMALAPNQPNLLADYADALASAREGDLSGPVQEAIDAALAIDPAHPKALALAGMAAYQRGDLAQARQHWTQVLALLPPESEGAKGIRADLAQLDTEQKPSASATAAAGAAPKQVSGTVAIAPALRDKVRPQDTVFVLARAAATGRMPVAVMRLQAKDLPARFVLDDSLAMRPEISISHFDQVSVEVRISRSGQAQAQAGDLRGTQPNIPLGRDGIALVADEVVE